MSKIVLLLAISIVFQSCFSYKAVENNSSQYEVGKSYRIQHGKKTDIVRIKTKIDSTLVVDNKFEEQQFTLKTITKAERRKFSILKTVSLPVSSVAALVLLFALAY